MANECDIALPGEPACHDQCVPCCQRRIEQLEADLLALTDTHDPVARGGHCMFCHHPIGLSVFGIDMHANELHHDGCPWIARRALEDTDG